MKREEAIELVEQGIELLNESLGQGRSDTLKQYLDVMSRFYRYSSRNCLLISSQRPDATQVAGFGNWKKLGRQVKKGEKGIGILAPLAYKTGSSGSLVGER